MTVDDWPAWLPADWMIQIRKIDERKVKCYVDPKGLKFYSKPQVERHLKTSTNNDDGPNLDLSLEPEDLDTNGDPESTPKGQSTRPRRTGSSGKKYEETEEELLAGSGSSSVPKSRGRKHEDSDWLPEGWNTEVKSKKSGQKYKIYISPNGKKLFSKPQVLSYLGSPVGKKQGDKTPEKSKISEPNEVKKDETRMVSESTRMSPDYEVISSTPADGLPPGWIKEIRARPHASGKKKDPYYLDPLSGYVFFSKLDALRYLDTGDVKKCAVRPLRRDMNQEINTEGELASPSSPTKEPETPNVLQNGSSVTESKTEGSGTEKRKVRSITGDGHFSMPISSQKSDDWLPEGWVVEMKYRDNGMKIKSYKEIATGKYVYSKPQLFSYIGIVNSTNSGKRKKKRKSSLNYSPDSESEGAKHKKSSRKTKDTSDYKETIETSPAEGLPPGWIKEIRTRVCGTNIRKDPFYTDPVSRYIFRSKLDALRYLDTGDINLCAIRPRMRDADGNEVAITDGTPKPKPKNRKVPIEDMEAIDMDKEVDHSDTDPKNSENTPDSTPGSGLVRRGTRDRSAKGKTSASPLPARSSTRIKGIKPHSKTDTLDENALQPDNGAAVEKGEAVRVNLDKQSGDVEHLDYQIEDDSSWTDQFDFAVKTLVGEFPPDESGGVGNGSPAAKVN